MYSAITNNIRISVFPEYDIKNSFPAENRFVFRYNITIENLGNDAVKLHKRRWLIYDLGFGFTEVNGDGVIGLTPNLNLAKSLIIFLMLSCALV
jgi:ApaG protein